MQTVATFTTPEDAHLFRTFLGSHGIEAFLLDEHFIQSFWYYSNTLGGVRLAVQDEDLEHAADIHQAYMDTLRKGPYPLQPVRAWPVVILLSILFSVPLPIFGRQPWRQD
ncbi:DUF2007 domain-containing protein [Luteolibacter yonseiensis]|uniref:DUF2007 domain-containing protein n=1 Tax=Luteolibacter yonseiensis TaxID=1144680 RepID=A0A934R7I8_9BACT|nr:DUF2007 domain-containing protein [Luteolibacter yonseiensis]MBK1817757.1 DUF2007 domain-containing protein [Luteolibacter yonseiensis]